MYNALGNSFIEIFNKTLGNLFKKVVNRTKKYWH